MEPEQKDRHLETPSEANRDKHINFLAREQGDIDPADEEVNNLNKDDSSTEEDKENGLDNGFFDEEEKADETMNEEEKLAAEKARREGPFKVNTRIY